MQTEKFLTLLKTPLGWLQLEATEKALTRVRILAQKPKLKIQENAILKETKSQLVQYFEGTRAKFSLPLEAVGTDFQKKVWNNLAKVPFGKLKSYRELAEAVGNAKAFRAVGTALGKNPLPIIVPCHRIVNSGKGLGGFTGGLHLKKKLLKHERVI